MYVQFCVRSLVRNCGFWSFLSSGCWGYSREQDRPGGCPSGTHSLLRGHKKQGINKHTAPQLRDFSASTASFASEMIIAVPPSEGCYED